jgi:hypothetical protein
MDNDVLVAKDENRLNGAAMASVLAAGIGVLAMGLIIIANESGVFVSPSIYPPAGGLSGRSTFAVIGWLLAWGFLHGRWRDRNVRAGRVLGLTLLLVALGLVMTFPPVWAFFG